MITPATLTSFASQLVGTPTVLSCDAPATFEKNELGYVEFVNGQPIYTIHLPTPTCARLEHLNDPTKPLPRNISYGVTLIDGKVADPVDAQDVLVFEHEAMHLALRSTDEACVERTAMANVWQAVRLFRLPGWKATQILRGVRWADSQMLPLYRLPCAVAS